MTTIRETILAAAVTAIESAVAPVVVYRSRSEAFRPGQLPAVVLHPESDSPSDRGSNLCRCARTLLITVDVVVTAGPVDSLSDSLVELIHAALMNSADPPGGEDLGLPQYGVDVTPGDTVWREANSGEQVGVASCRFLISYETAWGDLASSAP